MLLAYDWPGNVRELRNAMERAVVMADDAAIQPRDLPSAVTESAAPLRPVDAALAELPYTEARARAIDAFERSFLGAALERNGGNVSATARVLGLHRQSLQKMLRRLGLIGD
jgi:DNA-binding NtrC family response regulator